MNTSFQSPTKKIRCGENYQARSPTPFPIIDSNRFPKMQFHSFMNKFNNYKVSRRPLGPRTLSTSDKSLDEISLKLAECNISQKA